MKNKTLTLLFIVGTIIFASCSDEVKLQNTLTKDGGRWNIDAFKVTVTSSIDPDNPLVTEDFNIGEVTFYESNRGVWIVYDTTFMTNVAYYFEWENTANTVIMNFEDFPDDEQEFTINEVNKEEQIWFNEESEMIGDITITTATEIDLVREEEIANI
jgi:hypothetical protein